MPDPRTMHAPTGFHPERSLRRADLDPDPFAQFLAWLGDAEDAGVALPNAMALATADADGQPSVRHVLLRGVEDGAFVFYTNRLSRKGRELAENPRAGLVFLWKLLDRQVCVTGTVGLVDDADSDVYFASRPREARIGAWASEQSTVIADRGALDARVLETEERFAGGDVPRPPHWGGYRVIPNAIELWQGHRHRLHDRFRYTPDEAAEGGWRIDRLAP
ncbi:MAG: pyridoxamine 5'-phosphate oxidase [Actinomycetota bacterium]